MFRELAIAAAAACTAIGSAPAAMGDPNDNLYFDAHMAGPCDNFETFTFGRGPGGEPLQCHWIPNQWPPVTTGFWVATPNLFGVQDIGTPCPADQAAAQAPDGRPLLCLGDQGWQPGFFTGTGFWPT
jgi:hypothetical protein